METVNIRGLHLREVEIKDIRKTSSLTLDIQTTNHQYIDSYGFINHNSSILSDNISNGIEPVFSLEYNRTYIATEWPEGLNTENVKTQLQEVQVGDAIVWQGIYAGQLYHYEPHNRGLCIIETVRDYGYNWLLDNFPDEFGLKPYSSDPDKAFVPSKIPEYIVTTKDLTVEDHINSQAIIQKHTNQSISKTINISSDYSFEDFKNVYKLGWKAGLIGLTTYRAGTMESVLSDVEKKKDDEASELDQIIRKDIKLPDQFINGPTRIIKKEGKKFYINFSYLPEDSKHKLPIALWIQTNSDGEIREANVAVKKLSDLLRKFELDENLIEKQLEKIKGNPAQMRVGKMISMCLRHNIPIVSIVSTLDTLEDVFVTDLIFAVKKFLSEHVIDGTKVPKAKCNVCGSENIVYESGCQTCRSCGSTNCA